MKKLLVVLLSVAFVMAFAVGTVCAKRPNDVRAVFEADIISESAGPFGEVYIRDNAVGNFKVELKDPAAANKEFDVTLFCNGDDHGLGKIFTDENGEGKLESTLTALEIFELVCTQPTIVIEEFDNGGGLIYYSGFVNTYGTP